MPKSNAFETAMLQLLLNATAIANVADNAASGPLTNLYVAAHTADPGGGGTQSTSEISYTGYARVAVLRTTGGWVVTGSAPASASPVAAVNWPTMTGGAGGTITFFSVGSLVSGAGVIYYRGTVTPNIVVTSGVTPSLTTASTITEL